jgi:hypothetical protein
LAEKPSRAVTHYQITGLVGKAYLKTATAAIAPNKFQKTGFFPFNHQVLDEHDPVRISAQHHNLFVCTGISEEQSTTIGTNPQTLTNSRSAYLTKHHRCCPAL